MSAKPGNTYLSLTLHVRLKVTRCGLYQKEHSTTVSTGTGAPDQASTGEGAEGVSQEKGVPDALPCQWTPSPHASPALGALVQSLPYQWRPSTIDGTGIARIEVDAAASVGERSQEGAASQEIVALEEIATSQEGAASREIAEIASSREMVKSREGATWQEMDASQEMVASQEGALKAVTVALSLSCILDLTLTLTLALT